MRSESFTIFEVVLRGVIFDLDGTLADTLPVCYAAFRRVFLEYTGTNYSDEQIHALFGPCEMGVIREVVPDWRPAFQMFLDEYGSAHETCLEPFPGIVELFNRLGDLGIAMAIVTGKGKDSASISLRKLGIADRFEIVEAGSPDGPVKPEAMRRVLDLWNVDPGQVACVGDAPSDIRAARNCGTVALAAAWAPGSKRELLEAEGPDAIFDSVTELGAWIEAL